MARLILSLLLLYAAETTGWAQEAPPAQPFTELKGCTLLTNQSNDGDSFHVRTPDGKEHIFRLYFVDTPEAENSFPDRVAEQAQYFGIGSDPTPEVLRLCESGTGLFARPSRSERSGSHLWRSDAAPDGRDSREYLVKLTELENRAKAAHLGGWNRGTSPSVPVTATSAWPFFQPSAGPTVSTPAPSSPRSSPPKQTVVSPAREGQCIAVTKFGTRCTRKAQSGSSYCWQHQPK